jgi:hypothetical protein
MNQLVGLLALTKGQRMVRDKALRRPLQLSAALSYLAKIPQSTRIFNLRFLANLYVKRGSSSVSGHYVVISTLLFAKDFQCVQRVWRGRLFNSH